MYSTPGGPQQQLIQQLARSFGGQPTPARTTGPIYVDGRNAASSYTVPSQLTPYGAFHEDPNADEVGLGAGFGHRGFGAYGKGDVLPHGNAPHDMPLGVPPNDLHPMIRSALDNIRGMGLPDMPLQGLGAHPQVDRFHAIHAAQNLATLMAQLSQRSLKRNVYGGRH